MVIALLKHYGIISSWPLCLHWWGGPNARVEQVPPLLRLQSSLLAQVTPQGVCFKGQMIGLFGPIFGEWLGNNTSRPEHDTDPRFVKSIYSKNNPNMFV